MKYLSFEITLKYEDFVGKTVHAGCVFCLCDGVFHDLVKGARGGRWPSWGYVVLGSTGQFYKDRQPKHVGLIEEGDIR